MQSRNLQDYVAHSQILETVCQSRDCVAPVRNLEIAQFVLRTVQVSIMYKCKERMYRALAAPLSLLVPGIYSSPLRQGLLGSSPIPFPLVWYALTLLVRYIRKLCSCSLEIGAQFPDSESAQCKLQIARIPRLCGA